MWKLSIHFAAHSLYHSFVFLIKKIEKPYYIQIYFISLSSNTVIDNLKLSSFKKKNSCHCIIYKPLHYLQDSDYTVSFEIFNAFTEAKRRCKFSMNEEIHIVIANGT